MKFKNLLLCSIASLSATGAMAQSQPQNNGNSRLFTNHQAQLHQQHSNSTAAKATATGSRLIALVYLYNDGAQFVPTDSTTLTYSGTRGGDYTTGELKYDYGYEYLYNSTTSTYSNYFKAFQTFDANNNILTEIDQRYNTATNAYVNEYQYIYAYDANNNMVTQINQSWDTTNSVWVNQEKDIYAYDGNNNMTDQISQEWNTTTNTWVNDYKYLNTYNADNKEALSIVQNWDATNNAWINSSKEIYNYDANNNLTSDIRQNWDATNNVWVSAYQYIYTYANNVLQGSINQDWDATNNVWVNESQNLYSNYTGNNAQTTITQYWDGTNMAWTNQYEDLTTYNSYGQITTEMDQDWNVGGFWESTTNDYAEHFYYEDYTLAVKSVSQAGGTAAIYPVPAQANLQIDLNWNAAQDATISIYDMQGRLYRQLQTGNTAQYHNTMNVNDLAAGNYIINISGKNGCIVKQLTVSH